MVALIVLSVVAFVGQAVFAIIALIASYEMVARVNERLPEGQRFDPAWWWGGKTFRLHAEYRRLHPSGTARRRWGRAVALQFACFAIFLGLLLLALRLGGGP